MWNCIKTITKRKTSVTFHGNKPRGLRIFGVLPQLFSPYILFLIVVFILVLSPLHSALAVNVIIVGDTQYAMVSEMVSEIRLSLKTDNKGFATSDIKGKLSSVVDRENARIVIALGQDAITEALKLPSSIDVVYGLVVTPLKTNRQKVTGVYMSPPVTEYVSLVRRYLPSLNKFSVIGNSDSIKSLMANNDSPISAYMVNSPSDLVDTVNHLNNTKALLLLPDSNLLTISVMPNILLASFKKNIPLLGVSEANVKQGSLFALVFDNKTHSRQISEKTQSILNGISAAEIPISPPRKYNLFVNNNTALKMGIDLPLEMLKKAKRVY